MKFEHTHKLIKHSLGTNVAIGIEGKGAIDIFNLFWNWQATNGEANEVSENFVWFLAKPEQFVKGVRAIVANRLAHRGGVKGVKGGFRAELDVIVNNILAGIKEEKFVPYGNVINEFFSIGKP